MNEKFSIKTGEKDTAEVVRKLNMEEIDNMKKSAEKFEITRDFYRKAAFDSAKDMMDKWLKIKEIGDFSKTMRKVYPQS